MGDIVKYVGASAVRHHKWIQRVAAAARLGGAGSGKKSIIDGYITSTVVTDANNSVTRVIDPPAIVSWASPRVASGVVDYWPTLVLNANRDAFTPSLADPPVDIPAPTAELSQYTPQTNHKYVMADVPLQRNPTVPDQGAPGYANDTGRWACTTFLNSYRASDGNVYDSLVFMATSEGSPTGDVVVADTAATLLLAIPSEAIRAASGGYETTRFNGGTFNPYGHLETRTDAFGVVTYTVYVSIAVHVGLYTPGSDEAIFVARIDIVEGREQTFTWSRTLHTAPLVDGFFAGGTGGMSVIKGAAPDESQDVVMVHTTNNYPIGGAYTTDTLRSKLTTLNKLTGADVAVNAAGPGDAGPAQAMVTCSTDNSVWGVLATRVSPSLSAIASIELVRFSGATYTIVPTPGYYPAGGARLPGMTGNVASTMGRGRSVVADLGGGRVGVLVTPAADYGDHASIPYYVLEIDETTLGVVSVRGPIGSTPSLIVNGGYSKTLTVVTQQVVTDDIVTTPAVMLSCLGSTTRLSRDGGATWVVVAIGPYGAPLYRGNKLHPVQLGKTL